MRFFIRIIPLAVFGLILSSSQLQADSLLQKEPGIQATKYLDLLDQHKYQDAWQAMAPLYRTIHLQQHWQQRISAIRQAYGPIKSRNFRGSRFRSSYKNTPDGNYVVIQFESVFDFKTKGVETVVLDCSSENKCSIVDYIIN